MKQRPASTSASPYLDIHSVLVARVDNKSISIPVALEQSEHKTVETLALIDSGAGGQFIDQKFVQKHRLPTQDLEQPITAYNVDGTLNKKGTISKYVEINVNINQRINKLRLMITGLGKQKVILGFPWLQEENPEIDWKSGTLTWKEEMSTDNIEIGQIEPLHIPKPTLENTECEDEYLNQTQNLLPEWVNQNHTVLHHMVVEEQLHDLEELWINLKTIENKGSDFTKIPASQPWNHPVEKEYSNKAEEKKSDAALKDTIPEEYHDFLEVFSKEAADRFPTSRPWDHKIELKEGFIPKSFKVYNLTPEEDKATKDFITENLENGYIKESESPMALSFFFVSKKDGKLRPCQDYQYLNDWTIKNAYPLPLISDLMDKLKGANYFTKLGI